MSLTAEDVVRLLEADPRARRRLAELLVSEPGARLAIVSAALREVATRGDLERLAASFRSDVKALEARISGLERRAARVEGQLSLFVKLFAAFNLPTLLGVVGILLKMALAP